MSTKPKSSRDSSGPRGVAAVSRTLSDGTIVELAYSRGEAATSFVTWRDGKWQRASEYKNGLQRFIPYKPTNNLIRNGVVLLPEAPAEYGTESDLVAEIAEFIHRYVDLSPRFERIATYYVLLSWVFDRFNELPYLRFRGDYGSGKTRALLTVGSICYKPIFASGASTVAPIFHSLHAFEGTLVIDEADFRMSDEKADIVKILNNGNVRGLPVLRVVATPEGEFNPRAYKVFGPKLVATRRSYEDRALESRFLTEEMGGRGLRADIPISLPDCHRDEALRLRNKLLLFRFRNYARINPGSVGLDRSVEPRLNQIFSPLLSLIDDAAVTSDLRKLAVEYQDDLVMERSMDVEAQILEVLRDLCGEARGQGVPVGDVATAYARRFGADVESRVTPKWVGGVLRKQLGLRTRKSHGSFVVPLTEYSKVAHLCARYGLSEIDGSQAAEVA